MKIRVKELAAALKVEEADVIAVCTILKIQANSPLTSLRLEDAKKVTDFYEEKK